MLEINECQSDSGLESPNMGFWGSHEFTDETIQEVKNRIKPYGKNIGLLEYEVPGARYSNIIHIPDNIKKFQFQGLCFGQGDDVTLSFVGKKLLWGFYYGTREKIIINDIQYVYWLVDESKILVELSEWAILNDKGSFYRQVV